MASEIRATGVDLSFAPVVDLGRGNRAIGNRAFHAEPGIVADFTRAYVRGMHSAGMAATLKHFPGHGSVLEDTHFDEAVDPRPLETLARARTCMPFVAGIDAGADAVMMAHVTYPAVAPEPAGYSPRWMNEILRARHGLPRRGLQRRHRHGRGGIGVGGVAARIDAHLDAGCDVVLVCPPALVAESLRRDGSPPGLATPPPWLRCWGAAPRGWDGLLAEARYDEARSTLVRPRLGGGLK